MMMMDLMKMDREIEVFEQTLRNLLVQMDERHVCWLIMVQQEETKS